MSAAGLLADAAGATRGIRAMTKEVSMVGMEPRLDVKIRGKVLPE